MSIPTRIAAVRRLYPENERAALQLGESGAPAGQPGGLGPFLAIAEQV
jgi:hypothetical protein